MDEVSWSIVHLLRIMNHLIMLQAAWFEQVKLIDMDAKFSSSDSSTMNDEKMKMMKMPMMKKKYLMPDRSSVTTVFLPFSISNADLFVKNQ